MNKKCQYWRDSKVFYYDSEGNKLPYMCPWDAEVDGLCIFHKNDYWRQNKENEERIRKVFIEEVEKAKEGDKKLLCIGYHLPDIMYLKPCEVIEFLRICGI